MTATCAACQVTLPGVRSVIDRADALAEAVEAVKPDEWTSGPDGDVEGVEMSGMEWKIITDALAAYRNCPPPAYTTDDGRPLCPSCFWKSHAA